jgi:hypothetical protein
VTTELLAHRRVQLVLEGVRALAGEPRDQRGGQRRTGGTQGSVQTTVIDGLGAVCTVSASKDGTSLTYTFSPDGFAGKSGSVVLSGHGAGWTVEGEGNDIVTGADPGTCNDVSHSWKLTPVSGG